METNDLMIVFDLDDTLYKEIDFLHSAYYEIAEMLKDSFGLPDIYNWMVGLYKRNKDVFGEITTHFHIPITKRELLSIYRNHIPKITLSKEVEWTLEKLSDAYPLGLITDGRSVTQRNKIKALGLMRYLKKEDHLIISEEYQSRKPEERNYSYFQNLYPKSRFMYVGDNVEKDFLAPNRLRWTTVCLLDDGRNIHSQSFEKPMGYLPQFKIHTIEDIFIILKQLSF